MFERPLTLETLLAGEPNVAPLIVAIPEAFTIKGMFFKRYVELLGADYAALARELDDAPRDGRYVAFKGYSQRDYTRLVLAAARKRFPNLSPREGVRRLARDDMATFADSVIGKVVLAMAGDARSTLHRMPNAYAGAAPDTRISVVDLDPSTVRVAFEPHHGMVEYTLGQVEGIVLAFDGRPLVTLRELKHRGVAFDVQLPT